MSRTQSDIAVIGAGPAGAATAYFLAKRGYSVTLIERAPCSRIKPCGEYLTPGAVRFLRDEIPVLPRLMTCGAVRLFQERVVTQRGRMIQGRADALSCPRDVTDEALRDAAVAAGVSLKTESAARKIIMKDGFVQGVETEDGAVRARVTVGADGTHSLLARTLGLVRPIPRLQNIALVWHFKEGISEDTETVTMHLPQDGSHACCGVGSPAGRAGARNVNLVVPSSEAPFIAGQREDYFLQRLRQSFPGVWEQFREAAPVGEIQSVGCFGHYTARATAHGALLVGDAATFVHPFTGEGVFFALQGALLAAEAIDHAFKQGNFTQSALRPYDEARRRQLLPRYRLCDWVQKIVHSPRLLALMAAWLGKSPRLTESLLQTLGDLKMPLALLSPAVCRSAFSLG